MQKEVERLVMEMQKERMAPKLESPNYKYTYVPRYVALREEEELKMKMKNQNTVRRSPEKR